jgi:hypothetical protein
MERLRGMSDADYIKSLIAYHAAPTLLGIKPATLICPCRAGRDLGRALKESASCLGSSFGVRVIALRNRSDARLVFIYDPDMLRRTLTGTGVREFLAETGYDVTEAGADELVSQLKEKFRGNGFPHEIGVFLGYPVEDVRCFIERRGRGCRTAGCWKTYGNPERVKNCSARFQRAKMLAAELIVGGAGWDEVVEGLRTSAA